ncbi:MAG: sulfite exporter TauE/SafE family protein [Pseudomonadota bacterium]
MFSLLQWDQLLLLGVGLIGGIWNAIAGGATLFTFPALMFFGLPPMVANATNFLGLLPSNAAALFAYKHELLQIGWKLFPLVFVSGLGAIVGSILLVKSNPDTFLALVPFLILTAVGLFAFGDTVRRTVIDVAGAGRASWLAAIFLFVSSIYGGYFGAGLGIILLAIAQVIGYSDFHVANGIKNLLATSFTIVSIAIFGLGGLIDWAAAFFMIIGSTAGGYLGGHFAKTIDQSFLRLAVILFGLVLAGTYFWRVFISPLN